MAKTKALDGVLSHLRAHCLVPARDHVVHVEAVYLFASVGKSSPLPQERRFRREPTLACRPPPGKNVDFFSFWLGADPCAYSVQCTVANSQGGPSQASQASQLPASQPVLSPSLGASSPAFARRPRTGDTADTFDWLAPLLRPALAPIPSFALCSILNFSLIPPSISSHPPQLIQNGRRQGA